MIVAKGRSEEIARQIVGDHGFPALLGGEGADHRKPLGFLGFEHSGAGVFAALREHRLGAKKRRAITTWSPITKQLTFK